MSVGGALRTRNSNRSPFLRCEEFVRLSEKIPALANKETQSGAVAFRQFGFPPAGGAWGGVGATWEEEAAADWRIRGLKGWWGDKRPASPGKILKGYMVYCCGRGVRGGGKGRGLKLEALHGGLLLGEEELLVGLVHLGGEVAVLVFHPEVVLDQVEGLLVDLLVVVALQELDLVEAWR